MRAQHKKHFVVGGVDLQSNRVHGDYKILHREFMLDDPNPPTGIKMDWNAGKAMILYVEKGNDGNFPEVIVDSMTVQRTKDRFETEAKDPDGRIRRVKTFNAVLFYGCKKCTVKEFAALIGIKTAAEIKAEAEAKQKEIALAAEKQQAEKEAKEKAEAQAKAKAEAQAKAKNR